MNLPAGSQNLTYFLVQHSNITVEIGQKNWRSSNKIVKITLQHLRYYSSMLFCCLVVTFNLRFYTKYVKFC